MTTNKIAYGGSTTIPCTLASLASSATVGWGSANVDNTGNLYDDALVTIVVKTSSSSLANDKACYIYVYGSEDGTVYNASSAENVGTNASVTVDNPTNMKGVIVLACPAISTTYRTVFSIAQFFGGAMPRRWGFVLVNYTGQNLDSTAGNFQTTYSGINYTDS